MNLESIKTLINMNKKEFKKCMKERWIYYTFTYLLGYIYQLLMKGVHGWESLFPIKMAAFASAIVLGNILYDSSRKMSYIQIQGKAMKYALIMLATFLCIFLVQKLIFGIFCFDIMQFIGM